MSDLDFSALSASSSSSTAAAPSTNTTNDSITDMFDPLNKGSSSSSTLINVNPAAVVSPSFTSNISTNTNINTNVNTNINTATTNASTPASTSANTSEQSAYVAGSTFNFNDFLEKMRHPTSFDLVKSIKVFITGFLERPYQAEEQVEMVRTFLSQTAKKLATHPLWKGATDEELDNAVEGLEKYLMHKIYQVAYCNPSSNDAYMDECLSIRISRLHFLTAAHLDIKDGRISDLALSQTDSELRKMNTYKAPRDKLICILNCCKIIYNILQQIEGHPAGADEFLPILIYVILKSNPPKLHSNLLYIQRFRNPDKMASEAGYYFTNLAGAVTFIENMTPSQLSIDPKFFEAEMTKTAHLVPKTPAPVISPKSASVVTQSTSTATATTPTATPTTATTTPTTATTATTTVGTNLLSPSLPSVLTNTGFSSSSGSTNINNITNNNNNNNNNHNNHNNNNSAYSTAAGKKPMATPMIPPRPAPTDSTSKFDGSGSAQQAAATASDSVVNMFVSPEIQGAPIARFLNIRAEQLTIHEVFLLLNDYKRLAKQNLELTKTLCLNLGMPTDQ